MTQSRGPFSDIIGPGYTSLLITGLMLPVSGAVTRYVHFALVDGTRNPLTLAVTLPVAELAGLGLYTTVIALGYLAIAYVGLRFIRAGPRRLRLLLVLYTAFMALVTVGSLLAGATFGAIAGMVVTAAYFSVFTIRLGHPIRGRRVAVTLILFYATSAAFMGAANIGNPVGDYAFAGTSPVAAGRYIRLAESSSFVYLGSCSDSTVVMVPTSAIAAVTLQLWEPRPFDLLGRLTIAPPFSECL